MSISLNGKASRGKNGPSNPEKTKNRIEYTILALMLLLHVVYFLMPIHIRMAEKSCRGVLGLFFAQKVLLEVSLVDRSYILKSEQIVTKDFRAVGLSRDHLLSEISTERPIILVVEDDDLDKLTDKELVVVKDIYKGSSDFLVQYLYPLSYTGKKVSIVLHGVRKPEQSAIYA